MKNKSSHLLPLTSYLLPLTSYISLLTSHLSRLASHHGLRRYGANTAWLFSEQVLRMVAGFFVGVWVARYLGPEKFGIFSYSLAFVSLFGGIAKLGLDGIVVRDLVKEPEKKEIYLGTSFWLKLIGGIITFLIITIILLIQSILTSHLFTSTNLYILIIAFGIIFQSFEVIDFYYQATVQAKYISVRKMIQLFLSSIIKIILVLVKADLIWFVLVTLFDAISLAIFSWWIYKSQGLPNFIKYFDLKVAKRLLKDSWPIASSSLFIGVYRKIDQVFLQNLCDSQSVGIYNAAMRLIEIWLFIPVIVNLSLYPALVNAYNKSKELYYKRMENLFMLYSVIFMSIGIIFVFFSNKLVIFLYGLKYIESAKILPLLTWSSIFISAETIVGSILRIENKTKYVLYSTIWGAILAIILNPILIKKAGIFGATYTFLISTFTASLLFLLFYNETRKIFFLALKSILFIPLAKRLI
jgi:O-antigen/teichoic acid export membrane protein